MARKLNKSRSMVLCVAVGSLLLMAGLGQRVEAQEIAANPEARTKQLLSEAKDHGAKGQLPQAWWDLDFRFKRARKEGATAREWTGLQTEARRLINMANFVESMRQQKSGMEALLGRYEQAINEIAALGGISLPFELAGDERAAYLQDALHTLFLTNKVVADSLRVANRHLQGVVESEVAAQDSVITALRVENSSLRQKLWDMELRAGVAEADRSAAESVLTRKQQFEDAVGKLRQSFTPAEGEVLLSPGGKIMIRLHGMAFGVGSAELAAGQEDLIKRLESALQAFPGASLQIEGHTDDTGSREANLRLSRRRAETVARLLEHDLGLAKNSVTTEGYGPDHPVALNNSVAGRALNRRIDVVISTQTQTSQE